MRGVGEQPPNEETIAMNRKLDAVLSTHTFERPRLHEVLWERPYFRLPRRPTIKILVVVDGSVGVDPTYGFGVGKLIEILKKSSPHADPEFGFVNFQVQTASRDAMPLTGATDYAAFRFDQVVGGQPLIDQFHQIWCFGFHPGNTGNPDDAPIEAHATKVSDAELRSLTRWMNERKGGVLAMGDHHFLGATLASKIPRVRGMRRWTNADGVPPIDTPITSGAGPTRYRHDTNRPQNALQADPASSAVIPNSAEQDGIPQPIEVRYFGGLLKRPHPVLCGGPLGVIDVLPDHPHEGWVYEDAEARVDLTYGFGDVAGEDFPAAVDGGVRPVPKVIAWANALPEPPYDHAKAPTPVTRFPVIGVYDGHRADVGRVMVDSTWHHWFNMNIDGLQAAADGGSAEEQRNWAKVKTYFRNTAVWLSPPSKQRAMLAYAAFWSLGSPLAIEEYDGGRPAWELGESARDILGQFVSKCQFLEWVWPFIPERLLEAVRFPDRPQCLTCPPFELLENAVLGGVIKAMLPERERLVAERLSGKSADVDVERLALALEAGAAAGMKELEQHWVKLLEHSRVLTRHLSDVPFANHNAKQLSRDVIEELSGQEAGTPHCSR
jgi:hypothetical protein